MAPAPPKSQLLLTAASNDVLAGWPASNAVDGNPVTVYSSAFFPTSSNTRGTYLAAWLKTPQTIAQVLLTARGAGGAIQAFPPSYEIYVTAPDNSKWIDVGSFSTQPDSAGVATVQLPNPYYTYGVLIIPHALGVDGYGNHYFQLADINVSDQQCVVSLPSCPAYPSEMAFGGVFMENRIASANTSESACLAQASDWLHYCGLRLEDGQNVKTTYQINGVTQASKAVGTSGCEISMASCPANPGAIGEFYDNYSDNYGLGANTNEAVCMGRAQAYSEWCEINPLSGYLVTANFVQGAKVVDSSTYGWQHGQSACAYSDPLGNGWQGADGDDSVEFNAFGSVWLFDDTFVGANRLSSVMPRNTIGVSHCNPQTGQYTTEHYWKTTNGTASSFIATGDASWYWFTDSVLVNGVPYFALMRTVSNGQSGAFSFQYSQAMLGTFGDFFDPNPLNWTTSIQALSPTSAPQIEPGAAMAIDGNFLMLYTVDQTSYPSPVFISRIPLSGLGNAALNMQYLTKRGTWKQGLASPIDAEPVISAGQSEFTVRYHPSLNKWIALMTEPSVYFSSKVSIMEAPTPEGPWSAPVVIYSVPEMTPGSSVYNPNAFCYAAKEHPEYSPNDETLTFSYACNSVSSQVVASDSELYRPVMVSMPFPVQ